MTRRLRVAGAIALCAALGTTVARPARAEDPATPAVDVTVVGTADDLERIRALVPRLMGGGARWSRVDKLDPADVLRDRRDGDTAAVRAWVDVTVATRVRLYFATRSGDRFLVRDVDLSGRFDEVDRAALAEVLESSIGALVANERAGLTRAEAEAVLARREPPAAPPAIASPPPQPPQPPPPAPESPSRWAIGFFYAAQAASDDTLDHGPGVTISFAGWRKFASVHERGRGPALFASAQYRLPVHESTGRIGVALDTVAARAGVECGPLLWSRLRVRLGAGADIVQVTPESSDPAATLTGARWTASFVASAALRANLARRPGLFWLSAALFADVLPTTVRYDATIDGATTSGFFALARPSRPYIGADLLLMFPRWLIESGLGADAVMHVLDGVPRPRPRTTRPCGSTGTSRSPSIRSATSPRVPSAGSGCAATGFASSPCPSPT